MADNETLVKLVDLYMERNPIIMGDNGRFLDLDRLNMIRHYLQGLTDLYATIDHYQADPQFNHRRLTEDQNRLLVAHLKSHHNIRDIGFGSIYIALRLDEDEHPSHIVEGRRFERIVVGIF